ncbi:hypothetical protein [Schlesneria paludicola]|uniref:hypothetical protein n=1 Tax=Schlesneria paludicola TaxID=360056 RepID=UPI00029B4305|nr:hypothetical protein [Schlesneria paludicola]
MRKFFSEWRRKFGVLTLVMACVFTGAWVRGYTTFDRVTIAGRETYSVLHFSNCRFGNGLGVFFFHGRIANGNAPPRTGWVSHTYELTPEQVQKQVQEHAAYATSPEAKAEGFWTRNGCGFLIGGTETSSEVAIPYWAIVSVLTAFSTWLLLSKSKPFAGRG